MIEHCIGYHNIKGVVIVREILNIFNPIFYIRLLTKILFCLFQHSFRQIRKN